MTMFFFWVLLSSLFSFSFEERVTCRGIFRTIGRSLRVRSNSSSSRKFWTTPRHRIHLHFHYGETKKGLNLQPRKLRSQRRRWERFIFGNLFHKNQLLGGIVLTIDLYRIQIHAIGKCFTCIILAIPLETHFFICICHHSIE